ncbi:c-type cytochrome biogenesis protein CcsB [Saccharopolyspora sp. HNM0983]|uniref:C-type cytochrome biogenesis protein CcsB n=1 Tax=Saccharopolyspora montiporae TaxID=2781240 RepID=A0A929BB70_9PSEU|nr:c-type cytochrome biogenesis protein CcsB [Saccharopolyspora sp. HNM0983]MBE9374893.1 c-type cytochrome biogenesis protein CcsB [Saccharopolyspora sp. HNM0983]
MAVNETLSTYSDMAYATSVVLYMFAMLLYFAEFSYKRSANPAAAAQRERELVGAGGGSAAGTGVGRVETPAKRPMAERLGGMAVAITVLGALVHGASLIARGVSTGRAPWGNMYEFGSSICLAAVLAWLIVLYRQSRKVHRDTTAVQLRALGGFLMLPVAVLLFLSGTVLYAEASQLEPALQSYWIVIHVSAAIVSTGVLLLAGVASLLYLVRVRHENSPEKMAAVGSRLPGSRALDRVAYRATVIIFPVWTFAIVAGAIWAEAAWGRFWGWDPKETVSFIAWIVYAAYLHARATAGWRGVRSAWINVFGLAVMIFNLFFINIVVAGLHSYAGI